MQAVRFLVSSFPMAMIYSGVAIMLQIAGFSARPKQRQPPPQSAPSIKHWHPK